MCQGTPSQTSIKKNNIIFCMLKYQIDSWCDMIPHNKTFHNNNNNNNNS